MRSYGIGLDIGIASVGWAEVALDEMDQPYGILNMGSRIFDAAEQPKTGASLAVPRREARSARRRLRRHRHRNERIRAMLIDQKILSPEQLETLFTGALPDIYALRVRALDEPVTAEEFARILLHISQRRGFRSNRKNAASKEDGELLTAVSGNQALMEEKGYRTVAELFLLDERYKDHKRNKGGKYIATVSRDMVADEVRQIFSAQRAMGSSFASEENEQLYLDILLSQRSFDEGPGGDSIYSGNQIERMIGKCTFEPTEPRAAKATYAFEYFTLLQTINHIRIISGGASSALSDSQRQTLIDLAHKSASLDYAKIRKALLLTDEQTFNTVRYNNSETAEEAEKKTKLNCLKAYHQMRTAFDRVEKGRFASFSPEQRNELGRVLSIYKTSDKIRDNLRKAGFTDADMDVAERLSFSKTGHLSVKAYEKIIPYLEKGMTYNEACEAAGYAFRAHESNGGAKYLHLKPEELEDLTSPVVKRAVSQTIKVINAIIRERGSSPTFVNIELARELAKDFSERSKLKKEMDENRAKNERLLERIRTEYGKQNPTGQDLVKLRLFEEQGGVCAYSLKQMSLSRLFEPDYAEVDHIIPYSKSFDDSQKNKVLVLAEENRNKGNRLPLQYLTGKRRDNFIAWVNSSVRNYRKRQILLKEGITAEDEAQWKERNLQDTKTASRFLMNYIRDHLAFAPFASGRKKHVTAVGGQITAYMRKRWGISKVRANGDLHHAVDALVVACTTDGMIQSVSRYAEYRETEYMQTENGSYVVDADTGEVVKTFPHPWRQFHKELEMWLSNDPCRVAMDLRPALFLEGDVSYHPLFVSRAPRRKVTGAAHLETIKSPKALENGLLIVRRPLTDLKLNKSGEIDKYYMPQSDRLLYEALKARLTQFGGDGKKAFAEPYVFHKPKSDGTPGPVVNKVKLCEPTTLSVDVHGGKGAANHDSMVRIDVFHVENDGYYFVPIYVADTLKPELPNKACVAFKPYEEWKQMNDEDFVFSLYPNDLIKITHKQKLKLTKTQAESDLPDSYEIKSTMLYFAGAGISGASVSCRNHDNTYEIKSMGIKTLESLEKYTVDVLGEYHPVKKEKRQAFRKKEG